MKFSLVETKLQKCQLYCLDVFIVNEKLPWQRGSTKTKYLWRSSLLVHPSFLLKKNSCRCFSKFFAPVVEQLFRITYLSGCILTNFVLMCPLTSMLFNILQQKFMETLAQNELNKQVKTMKLFTLLNPKIILK